MYALKEVSRGRYDDRGYSNEETIANLMLQRPEEVSKTLTYTFGMDDDRFPLSFMTEGQGNAGVKDINTIQFTWKTMGRMKFDDYVTHAESGDQGAGGTMFKVHFASHWLIEQYGLIAPDGTQVRIMKDLGASEYGYAYMLKITSPNPTAVVAASNLEVGKYWSMTAPTVSESYSKGNRSNSMGPGKMTSQIEIHRFSKEIAGDISHVVVEYEFKNASGGTTNLWINEEMRQLEIQRRVMQEERLWFAQYNRNTNGEVTLLDPDNGQPIPHTAGMIEICDEANYDTYGEFLTLNKLERTIGDVTDKNTDTGSMDIMLAVGKGFAQDFDMAIRNEVKGEGFITPLGEKMIETNGEGLSYGKYFNRYKTIDGHTITLKILPFLDKGTIAEAAKKNGMIHPRTGLPLTSHQAFMIDMSSYGGEANVRKLRKKGKIHKIGILKGLTDIPASWGAVPTNSISTEIDVSRYEVMDSIGLHVANANKMFHLKCVM